MSVEIFSVTDSSFDNEVLQSELPILVDFWAEWCNPCKMLTPVLEDIAPSYKDKVKIVKLNVDSNHATTSKYGVRGIPALLLFKNGKVAATKAGYMDKAQLSEFLDSHL